MAIIDLPIQKIKGLVHFMHNFYLVLRTHELHYTIAFSLLRVRYQL